MIALLSVCALAASCSIASRLIIHGVSLATLLQFAAGGVLGGLLVSPACALAAFLVAVTLAGAVSLGDWAAARVD
jgi:hypothetical protein